MIWATKENSLNPTAVNLMRIRHRISNLNFTLTEAESKLLKDIEQDLRIVETNLYRENKMV